MENKTDIQKQRILNRADFDAIRRKMYIQHQLYKIRRDVWSECSLAESIEEFNEILEKGRKRMEAMRAAETISTLNHGN